GEYGRRLGLAFQLVDDCLDYEGGDTGKEVGRDFCEGKMTLPVILALEKMPEKERDKMMEGWRGGGDEAFAETVRQTHQSGALTKTREAAKKEAQAAATSLKSHPPFQNTKAANALITLALTSPSRTA
ncbi:MAG: polyprenyl synthetase family protein, partial [Gammaproteobacteria bacterium]